MHEFLQTIKKSQKGITPANMVHLLHGSHLLDLKVKNTKTFACFISNNRLELIQLLIQTVPLHVITKDFNFATAQ